MSAIESVHPESLISENLKTTSLCIARHFGKQHKDVLRKIEVLEIPSEYHQRNFTPMIRGVEIGKGGTRQSEYYQMTRDGFALLVMGFTGKRAMEWKIKFLEAFNAMEAELRAPQSDSLTAFMEKTGELSVPDLKRFIAAMEKYNTGADDSLPRLITYLETLLLDRGMAVSKAEALRSVLRIARAIRSGDTLPTYIQGEAT